MGLRISSRWFVGVVAASTLLLHSYAHAADDPKHTIGISFPNAGQPIVQKVIEFARQRAQKDGFSIVVDDPGEDLSKQVATLDQWIDSKLVATIICVVPTPAVFEAVAERSKAAGIPWITYAARIKNETATITWDHEAGGHLIGVLGGQWINEHLKGNAEVAILGYEPGEWSRHRREGIEKGLHETAPNAKIVAQQDALDPSTGAAVTDTILQAHPHLQVVLAIVPGGGEGAYQALLNAGHKPDDPDLFVADVDGSARSLNLISENTFYRGAAALSLRAVGDAVGEVPVQLSKGAAPRDVIVPYKLVTHANIGDINLADWK